MPHVRLVDLAVIRRYSLAIRQETADAAELLGLIETDRKTVEKLVAESKRATSRRAAPKRARSTAAREAPAKKASGARSRSQGNTKARGSSR